RVKGYPPPGIPDGLGVLDLDDGDVHLFMSHELGASFGDAYTLANGTELNGARITAFRLTRSGRILEAGLAYDEVYDRSGRIVTAPTQINERGHPTLGFARFCSARSVEAGTFGFVDDIFFTGEELSSPAHIHGGSEWALDVACRAVRAVPAMGRGAWENVAPVDTGNPNTIALLAGDDVSAAPLYLFIGVKNAVGDGSFLDRNGLAVGRVYVWAAADGSLDPEDFNGTGSTRSGSWMEIDVLDPAKAGQAGYDSVGYLDDATLRATADAMGAFSFSRPEDVHDNPNDPSQMVLASTGRGNLFPADNWGTLYRIDLGLGTLTANLTILFDGDSLAVPDTGIRSPDNLTWSADGMIYVQEDRSTSPSTLFGALTGTEASVWMLDPVTGAIMRIGEIDRSAVAPADATSTPAKAKLFGNADRHGKVGGKLEPRSRPTRLDNASDDVRDLREN
ncbi:MAG: PhoX family protein, partial [Planctomycetota bacterium]|nr:PhoX family protein [Planctomycetota bacterium]